MSVVSEVIRVGSVYTRVYANLSPRASSRRYVVFPGNPGSIAFYEQFIRELYEQLEESGSVLGVSHAGHDAPGCNGSEVYTLEDQVLHKVVFLRGLAHGEYECLLEKGQERRRASSHGRFVVCGHSIGALIGLKAWRCLEGDEMVEIERAVMLMPVFSRVSLGLSVFAKAVIRPVVRSVFALACHYACGWIAGAVGRIEGMQAEFKESLVSFLRERVDYYTVYNMTRMGHEELGELSEADREVDAVCDRWGKRITLVYSQCDPYTPKGVIEEARGRWREVSVELAELGVSHAFVVRSAVEMARRVAALLSELS